MSIPFREDNGLILVRVHVLNQTTWAELDSGSDINHLSFKAAKSAAIHLLPTDAKTVVINGKIGVGSTNEKLKVIEFRAPVPISISTRRDAVEFNTTSWFGTSDVDDEINTYIGTHIDACLGLPFFLQFQRVIIDYPSHTLILQYPARNTFIKATLSPTNHDKPWPGYKWRQVGYAWIEVPDGKSAPVLPAPVAPTQATATQATSTTTTTEDGTTTTVVTTKDGTTAAKTTTNSGSTTTTTTTNDGATTTTIIVGNRPVIINGNTYVCPPGTVLTFGADGVVHMPTMSSSAKTDGQTSGSPSK